jgi:hypothetical protein
MSKKLVNINIKPIVYEKNSNGDYVIDTNGDKIVEIAYPNVKSTDDYDYKIEITEFI